MKYMEQVANILGVELNEEFCINLHGSRKYRFTEHGMEDFHEPIGQWMTCDYLFSILNGTLEIMKIPKPILDAKEKEYLSAVIKPFRNCITSVTKRHYFNSYEIEYISVTYIDRLMDNSTYIFSLPNFKSGTMYKGMESGKHYTLEELGL